VVHILVALDGSAAAQQARDLVASLSWPHGTSITLLTAIDIPAAWMTAEATTAIDWLPEAEEAMSRETEASLVGMAAPLDGRGWTIDHRVVRGRPASAVLTAADELEADLIVLGSRGHGAIASMLLGSVSAEVADQADCSVLVARAPRVSSLLVATDGSDSAVLIPEVLAGWGSFGDLPAIALSVTPVDSPAFELMVRLYTLGRMSLEHERDELRERYGQYAAAMAASLSANGIPARADVRSGDAADEIIRAAADAHVDIIVTGSRRLRGLDRWLLGSVARNVAVHAATSVLIVRQQDGARR
jgi:nucleotide-binding universal stress UspA family protein